jgi:hypothetical protein
MAGQNLQEFFSFKVAYKKYPGIGAGLFQFEPTEAGAKTLQSYGLHFKEQDQGFVIAAPGIEHGDTGLWELQNQFGDREKLSFVAFTRDPDFFDRAELPYDPPGEYIYYFNNCNAKSRSSKLLLDNCGVKVGERVKLHPKQFTWELVKDEFGASIAPGVCDCWGNTVSATQYDYSVDGVQNTYTLDLSRLADGLYTIEYNGQATTGYCAKASFMRRIPLLILEVFVGAAVPEDYQVMQRIAAIQYIHNQKFHLYFGNYWYYWRYKIIPVNTPLFTGLAIQTDQSDYSFAPARHKIDCYRNPVRFTSERPIDTPNDDLAVNLYRFDYGAADPKPELVGPLPKAEAIKTAYYTEDDRAYAQMTLYLVYENGQYQIRESYEEPVNPVTNFSVVYTQFDWGNGSGATVNVTIKNNGATAVNGWTLKFSFAGDQKITGLWRGIYTQYGTKVTVTNEFYNGMIPAGGTETFGFNLCYSGANPMPTSFVVNGAAAPNSNSTMTVDNFVVSYRQSDWYNGNGATVNVAIKNTGTTAVDGWKLAFRFNGDQKITDLWCGAYIQRGTEVVVSNAGYNRTIAVGATVNFGFNISYSNISKLPTSFTVYVD